MLAKLLPLRSAALSKFRECAPVRTAKPDMRPHDGHWVGADGRSYPSTTALGDVPAVQPKAGSAKGPPLVHVNGVDTQLEAFRHSLQLLADTKGRPVVGLYNATEGLFRDLRQALGDRFDRGENAAVDTATRLIRHAALRGEGIDFSGHSQGALILSRAFARARRSLESEGMSKADVDQRFSRFTLLTAGGAASRYDDAPETLHLINRSDIVQLFSFYAFGVSPQNRLVRPGAASQTEVFRVWNPKVAHSFELYLSRLPPVSED